MEKQEKDLSCPCMPQCPNYGKCRQCIAAHAEYYTVPHCIKKMQEDMKKNHYHPSNPHIKKSLPERIKDYYEKNPNAHLRTVAEAMKITEWQLLDAMEGTISVPVSDYDSIYEELRKLDRVLLHLDTGSVVLQLETSLPKPLNRGDIQIIKSEAKAADTGMSLTSLIMKNTIYAIFLVRESLCGGKESLSIALVGEDEKIALSIYLRRNEEGAMEEKSKALFEALWNKYQN